MEVLWFTLFFFFFGGAKDLGGPWPPSQYATRPLDPLLCLSIRLLPAFSVRVHVIQAPQFWSSFSLCCMQLSVHHLAFLRRLFRIKRFFVLICVIRDSFLFISQTRNCAIGVFRRSFLLSSYVIVCLLIFCCCLC